MHFAQHHIADTSDVDKNDVASSNHSRWNEGTLYQLSDSHIAFHEHLQS